MRQKEPTDFQSVVFRFLEPPEMIGALFKKKKKATTMFVALVSMWLHHSSSFNNYRRC